MSDIEERLRAAMLAAAEPPPPGLMHGVRRKHRRRLRRVTAAWVSGLGALAVAGPAVTSSLLDGAGSGAPAAPVAAPGTVLSGCTIANPGEEDMASWRNGLRAGPVSFLQQVSAPARLESPANYGPHLYAAVVILAGLTAETTVVVRPAPGARASIRFLYGPGDSLSQPTYTMRSGEAGVTFVACPAGTGSPHQKVTDYWGGYLIPGRRCVPIDVWAQGRARPYATRVGDCQS
jgi:hypothetical protein